jgi:tripartite-type tricarboxylate transporter receptor subunit TctC
VRDFVPVVLVTTSPLVLIVPPSSPAQTVGDLIAMARHAPGELSFGSYGTGSINHLAAELFDSMAGIKANHIPYRGAAPALTDLVAGRLHYTFDGVATSLGYARAGTIRMLGVTAPQRASILPDLPTIAEQGLPGFDTTVWSGLFAPASTPPAIVEKINRSTNAVLAAPGVVEGFVKLGIEPAGGTADVLATKVTAEMRKWASIVRDKGIRVEP